MQNKIDKQQLLGLILPSTIICYNAPRSINIGDVFYMIVRGKTKTFHEPCKVCEGTRKLTINGVTFDCPCCGKTNETITVAPYVVRRMRVYTVSVRTLKDKWEPSDYRRVEVGLYHKEGRGYTGYGGYFDNNFTKQLDICSFTELNPTMPDDATVKYSSFIDHAIYDNYKKAVEAADDLTAHVIKTLSNYNIEHGTDYKAEFEEMHDKKSK